MKLAEALAERKDITKKIAELGTRACANATVEKGETPLENVGEIITEIESLSSQLQKLIVNINLTNNQHGIMEKSTLRDMYRNLSLMYRNVASSSRTSRYGRDEISYVTTVDVKEMNKKADEYSNQARKLDMEIQQTDWEAEIVS